MIMQRVRRVGNSLAISIPREEADRLGLREGDMVAASLNKVRLEVQLVREATDRFFARYSETLDYLAER